MLTLWFIPFTCDIILGWLPIWTATPLVCHNTRQLGDWISREWGHGSSTSSSSGNHWWRWKWIASQIGHLSFPSLYGWFIDTEMRYVCIWKDVVIVQLIGQTMHPFPEGPLHSITGGAKTYTIQLVFNLVSHYLFQHFIIFPPRPWPIGDLPCRAILRMKLKRHWNVNYSARKWFSLYTKNKESQNIKRLPMHYCKKDSPFQSSSSVGSALQPH